MKPRKNSEPRPAPFALVDGHLQLLAEASAAPPEQDTTQPMNENGRPLESQIQSRIIKRLQADGWLCVRLIQTNMNGIPDLLCMKDGQAKFIEVKRHGEQPRPLQVHRHEQLRQAGFVVEVMDDQSIAAWASAQQETAKEREQRKRKQRTMAKAHELADAIARCRAEKSREL